MDNKWQMMDYFTKKNTIGINFYDRFKTVTHIKQIKNYPFKFPTHHHWKSFRLNIFYYRSDLHYLN